MAEENTGVARLIADLEHERNRPDPEDLDAEPGKFQVNIRLPAFTTFQLDQLAERYGERRAGLAATLLNVAIAEAWRAAEMPNLMEDTSVTQDFREWIEEHA